MILYINNNKTPKVITANEYRNNYIKEEKRGEEEEVNHKLTQTCGPIPDSSIATESEFPLKKREEEEEEETVA